MSRERNAPSSRWRGRATTAAIYLAIAALSLAALWPLVESERLASRARAAAERGDYATALETWTTLAGDGDSAAQFSLGVLHDRGLGTPEDPEKAVSWYRRAAEQGVHAAQVNLGLMLIQGRGTAVDETQAAGWFGKAARANVPEALANLGYMHRVGRGVERDVVRAYGLLRRAALLGNPTAALGVAEMLAAGEGVDADPVEALAWAFTVAEGVGGEALRARRLATQIAETLDANARREAVALATRIARETGMAGSTRPAKPAQQRM